MENFPLLTLREAAFVLGMPHETVVRELDAHPGHVERLHVGSSLVRQLRHHDLAFLRSVRDAKGMLSSAGKDEIYNALVLSADNTGPVQFLEMFYIDARKISGELDERLRLLGTVRSSVDRTDDGPPLIKGTKIEAYRVAALASTSIDEARFEYPSLSSEQIEMARQYGSIYPKPGRPYPTQSLKRMLLSAGFDELNEVVAKGRETGTIYAEKERKSARPATRHTGTARSRKAEK